jgi:hypothetical protein
MRDAGDRDSRREVWQRSMVGLARERRAAAVPGWVRGRGVRRALAGGTGAPFLLAVVSGVADAAVTGSGGGLAAALGLAAGVLVAGPCWLGLRQATRLLVETPADALDEREMGEREAALARAHVLSVAVLAVLVALGTLGALTGSRLLTTESWPSMLAGALLTAGILPTAVAAWRWAEPDGDI